jgi:hypothetical protein
VERVSVDMVIALAASSAADISGVLPEASDIFVDAPWAT